MLGRVLRQVERGAPLHSAGPPPACVVASFLWGGNRHGSGQLELHLYEASVGPILVLLKGKKTIIKLKDKNALEGKAGICCEESLLTMFMNRLLLI